MQVVFWTMKLNGGHVDHYEILGTPEAVAAKVETLKGLKSVWAWGVADIKQASEPHWTETPEAAPQKQTRYCVRCDDFEEVGNSCYD